MAQEGLGRAYDVVPIASGVAISMKNCSGITYVCTGADTFTLSIATSFGGTYRAASFFTPAWAPINHYYQRADTNGTHAFTRVAQTAAAAVTQAGAFTTVIELLAPMLPDTYDYVKLTASVGGLVKVIMHDLLVQRTPANLVIPSA